MAERFVDRALDSTSKEFPGIKGLRLYFGILVGISGVFIATSTILNKLDALAASIVMGVTVGAAGVVVEAVNRRHIRKQNSHPSH
jgi:hypothetical protein